jgi:hypothetical protein
MSDPPVDDRFTFNAYDLFSNFLPGAVLFLGIGLPFIGLQDVLPDLNLVQALSAIIIAFGLGTVTQSIGSMASRRKVFSLKPLKERDRPFNEKMNQMLECEEPKPDFSNIDWAASRLCIEAFDLDGDGTDNTEYVFKSLLAYLESSKWNRGLRMQALHLASRGLYVVCLILGIYYISFGIGFLIPTEYTLYVYSGEFSLLSFIALGGLMFIISYILFLRARHFEDDVVIYILSEFVMSAYDWDNLDLGDLDMLDDESGTTSD